VFGLLIDVTFKTAAPVLEMVSGRVEFCPTVTFPKERLFEDKLN